MCTAFKIYICLIRFIINTRDLNYHKHTISSNYQLYMISWWFMLYIKPNIHLKAKKKIIYICLVGLYFILDCMHIHKNLKNFRIFIIFFSKTSHVLRTMKNQYFFFSKNFIIFNLCHCPTLPNTNFFSSNHQ